MKEPYMNTGHAAAFSRHIAALDTIITQRRAALIRAEGQRDGYIWH